MRRVNRPTPRQRSPRDRSGVRSAGHAGGVVARTAVVLSAVVAVGLAAATRAVAQEGNGQLISVRSATDISAGQSDPMVFGLGLAGLFWLLAGLLALVVGLALATHRVRRPAIGGAEDARHAVFASKSTSTSRSTSTRTNRAGGAEK